MGTYFDAAHALVPACNPSRTATLTGQSLFRTGVYENGQKFFDLVDPSTTLPHLMKDAGYRTALIGKVFHGLVERGDLDSPLATYLRPLFDTLHPASGWKVEGNVGTILDGIGPTTRPESDYSDYRSAEWAARFVESQPETDPDVGKPGSIVHTPVSLLDIFPTITELLGLQDDLPRDGHSLVTLLRDPTAPWHDSPVSVIDGSVSLRTDRYRYIASLDGSEQLYDMVRDPEQYDNLAVIPGHRATLRELNRLAGHEIERLGGHLDFLHDRLEGTDDDETFFVSPNASAVIGGGGDDAYLAIDPSAIHEAADGGTDSIRLFAPREGAKVDVVVPQHVELARLEGGATGRVRGNDSDNVLIGGRKHVHLAGAGGDDVLVGSGSADVLNGNRGADRLRGEGGDDRLRGGPGNDWLRGDEGRDTFGFRLGSGVDRIVDFRPGHDRIDLSSLDLQGFPDLEQQRTAEGWAVVVVPEADVQIVLEGVRWADLDAADFLF